MFWLIVLALVGLIGWIDWLTLRLVFRQNASWLVKTLTILLIVAGIPLGGYSAFVFRYFWSDRLEIVGFPIPFMALKLENGEWIDYVGSPLLGLLSMFLILSLLLLPIALSYFIKWSLAKLR